MPDKINENQVTYDAYSSGKTTLYQLLTFELEELSAVAESTNKKFVIPIYQRDYSWDDKAIESFLYKMDNIEREPYYLGSVVLAQNPIKGNLENTHNLEIVDGQQRLSTYFLFAHSLLRFIIPYYYQLDNNYEIIDEDYKKFKDGEKKKYKKKFDENTIKKKDTTAYNKYQYLDFKHQDRGTKPPSSFYDGLMKWFIRDFNSRDGEALSDKLKFDLNKHKKIWGIILSSKYNFRKRGEETAQIKQYDKLLKSKVTLTSGDKALWKAYVLINNYISRKFDNCGDPWTEDFENRYKEFFDWAMVCLMHPDDSSRKHLHLTYTLSKKRNNGIRIFNLMNSEGVQLSQTDLIKGHIYQVILSSNAEDKDAAETLSEQFMNRWDELEKKFPAKSSTKNALFNDFLLHNMYTLYHGDFDKVKKDATSTGSSVNTENIALNYNDSYQSDEKIAKLMNELELKAQIYLLLRGETDLPETICTKPVYRKRMETLLLVMRNALSGEVQHLPILLKLFYDLRDSNSQTLVFDETQFKKLINTTFKIMRFKLMYTLNNGDANLFRPNMNNLIDKLRIIEKKDFHKTVEKYTKPAATIEDYNDAVNRKLDKNDEQYEKERRQPRVNFCPPIAVLDRIKADIDDGDPIAFESNNNIPKGLLYIIMDYLNDDFAKLNVAQELEHIFPQTYTTWGDHNDLDNLIKRRFRLGNMAVIKKDDNASIGNMPWKSVNQNIKGKAITFYDAKTSITDLVCQHAGVTATDTGTANTSNSDFNSETIDKLNEIYANHLIRALDCNRDFSIKTRLDNEDNSQTE